MNKTEKLVFISIAVAIIACMISFAAINAGLPTFNDRMENGEWMTGEPPEGKAVLAIWYRDIYARSHVVVRVRDWYMSYGPENEPQEVLEDTMPAMWRILP